MLFMPAKLSKPAMPGPLHDLFHPGAVCRTRVLVGATSGNYFYNNFYSNMPPWSGGVLGFGARDYFHRSRTGLQNDTLIALLFFLLASRLGSPSAICF